ncbi:MAG: glycyl-radical enzyme activating protein [Defluviitaleaceae bacterium]|nr:glycyl-radical enzyme activating protein [Defluviitaleaceae bacterium]
MGNVFNIQRYSIHDGPGIRTTVFLKGCGLRCAWCHNPESFDWRPQIQFFSNKCIGCGRCRAACENVFQIKNGESCERCGKCAEACFAGALVLCGKSMTADEVLAEADRDRDYYAASGGGVTFSGGEPIAQAEFLLELLEKSKSRGYHTAVETAGFAPWKNFEKVLRFVDLWLYDVKMVDEKKHKEFTGQSNALIKKNLRRLAESGADIFVRIPVVPGVNDGAELLATADFLEETGGVRNVEPLRLNHLAEGKFLSLGMEYAAKKFREPSQEEMAAACDIFMKWKKK